MNVILREEAARCLLCHNPACTAACEHGLDPARAIRAVRFDNAATATDFLDYGKCAYCDVDCEVACVHYDRPIRVRKIAGLLPEREPLEAADLSIDFCGVRCENPFFLSSSIVAASYEMCRRAFELGWGGAVFKTIGMLIPNEVSPRFDALTKEGTPFVGFKNLEQISDHPLEENLETLRRLKQDFPSKVIVASIMGQTDEEWTELAALCEQAGADILECNFSCPQMAGEGLGSDVGQNPELVARYTAAVRRGSKLPILAKMTPNIGSMEIPAIAAIKAGADGIAAINTIKSITGIDPETLLSAPNVAGKSAVGGYSGKAVKPIALRFVHDLATCREISGCPISGIGGIETWRDALEFILLGASNIQITTAVMQYGYRIIDDLISGLSRYMTKHNIKRLDELVGKGLESIVSADALDRNSYVLPLFSAKKCVKCGRCFISCEDGGHGAIILDGENKPRLNGKKCVGCHLCRLVCPVGAISETKRIPKK